MGVFDNTAPMMDDELRRPVPPPMKRCGAVAAITDDVNELRIWEGGCKLLHILRAFLAPDHVIVACCEVLKNGIEHAGSTSLGCAPVIGYRR
jgi:hypothetical protein